MKNEIISVTELSRSVKRTLEENYRFVRVKGEITGIKQYSSGHLYFSLKDDESVIMGICWKSMVNSLKIFPTDGMEVICSGQITAYSKQSKYQIIARSIEPSGEGALLKLLEERKKRLSEEGLFRSERKKTLPYIPNIIGVITSPSGAVIQDIIHRINDRFPRRIILWPVTVQGEKSAEEVSNAIYGFNQLIQNKPDLIIVARGGGSLEDLWSFNEENVVRAVADSKIPIISAIGHETDTTLIDYAADHRAPTPTAAAEKAVPVRREILSNVINLNTRLIRIIDSKINNGSTNFSLILQRLPDMKKRINEQLQWIDDRSDRINNAFVNIIKQNYIQFNFITTRLLKPKNFFNNMAESLSQLIEKLTQTTNKLIENLNEQLSNKTLLLKSYSYKNTLNRGFSLIHDTQKNIITNSAMLSNNQKISITFRDGETSAIIKKNTSK